MVFPALSAMSVYQWCVVVVFRDVHDEMRHPGGNGLPPPRTSTGRFMAGYSQSPKLLGAVAETASDTSDDNAPCHDLTSNITLVLNTYRVKQSSPQAEAAIPFLPCKRRPFVSFFLSSPSSSPKPNFALRF
jgi:hypothetical protein